MQSRFELIAKEKCGGRKTSWMECVDEDEVFRTKKG